MAAAQDVFVGRPVVAGLFSFCWFSPRRYWMTAAGGGGPPPAMLVGGRVHGDAAHHGPAALPSHAASLADRDVRVVGVGDCTDGGHALSRHHARLARVEPQDGVAGIAADKLDIGPGGAGNLSALALLHLHIADDGADRDVGERHGVAVLNADAGI